MLFIMYWSTKCWYSFCRRFRKNFYPKLDSVLIGQIIFALNVLSERACLESISCNQLHHHSKNWKTEATEFLQQKEKEGKLNHFDLKHLPYFSSPGFHNWHFYADYYKQFEQMFFTLNWVFAHFYLTSTEFL